MALSEQTSLPLEGLAISYPAMPNPISFRYFKTSPEIIQLAVMLGLRFPLSLKNLEDLLHERGVDVSYETVRYWWHRFGPKKPWKNFRTSTNTAVLAECNGTADSQ